MFNLKNLPNAISISRIIVTVVIVFFKPLSIPFYICYIYCGLSDVIDGILARKFNAISKAGALIDSIADALFVLVSIFKLIPIFIDVIPMWCLYICSIIIITKLLIYIVGAARFNCFTSLHTILSKLTGFAIFLVPMVLKLNVEVISGIACGIALLASIDELICIFRMKDYNPNIKFFLEIKKGDN